MMIIDTDNYAEHGIEVFQFPGGEWHANVPNLSEHNVIRVHAKLRTWDDLGKLVSVASALRTQKVHLSLFCPYFPGMRQDRNPGGNTPLTVEIYAGILARWFEYVTVVDPHSDAAMKILRMYWDNSIRVIDPTEFLSDLIPVGKRPSHVLIPDKGAYQRSTDVADLFGVATIQATKVRDFETGKLSGFSIPFMDLSDVDRILIPDDICDGGGTFLGLLAEIRKQTDAPVDLYVTHGIFSKGLQILRGFDNIYTTDSFYEDDQWLLSPVKFTELLPHDTGDTQ